MNQRSYLRLAIHLAVVLVALGLGLAVRAMLPAKNAAVAATKTPAGKAAPPAGVPPVLPEEAGRNLAGLSPAEAGALRDRIRNMSRGSNPVRDQLMLRMELLAGITSVEDLQRALEFLDASGTDVNFREEIVTALAERLAEIDPAGATGALIPIKDRQVRHTAVMKVMEAWARRDPEAALAFVRTRNSGLKSNALTAIFRELAKANPAAAIARSGEFDTPGFSQGLDRIVLSEWWLKDRDAALAWVNGREPAERKKAMSSLLDVAGNRDPEGAWKLMQSMPVADRPDMWGISNLLYMWAHKDANAALDAVLAETDTARRGDVLQRLGRTMKLVDDGYAGEERGAGMLAKITDESMRQRFLYGMVEGNLNDGHERDYRHVLDLTMQLTDEKQRLEMIKSLGGSWGKADAPAASEWLNTLQPGGERDAAIGEFVRGTFATDPAAALTWSASIADDGKRSRRLMELYPKWLKTDAAAAGAWLSQQTVLSQTDRAALEAGQAAP
ncbi:MAG TPA: hypothetical protein VG796_13200 [Verrucomicrobiales bacterium]|nr:hypothetical protein [Verrucomicrobiales bacterium]